MFKWYLLDVKYLFNKDIRLLICILFIRWIIDFLVLIEWFNVFGIIVNVFEILFFVFLYGNLVIDINDFNVFDLFLLCIGLVFGVNGLL